MVRILSFLILLLTANVALAQQVLQRPNIESAQRALQERYIRFAQAAQSMELPGSELLDANLTFPARIIDGMKPGLYPDDCFYESDQLDPLTRQVNLQVTVDLIVDMLQKMVIVSDWGSYWVAPPWQGGLDGKDAVNGKILVIDDIEDYYPGGVSVGSGNYISVFSTIVAMLDDMQVLNFQISTDASVSTLPLVQTGQISSNTKKMTCATIKSLALDDYNSNTPVSVSQPGAIIPFSRVQRVFYDEGTPKNRKDWEGLITTTTGKWTFDYSPIGSASGTVEIYGRLDESPESVNGEPLLLASGAPHDLYDEWFSIGTASLLGGGTYNSPVYADPSATSFVIGCPTAVGIENKVAAGWDLYGRAVFKPEFTYFPSRSLISSCNDDCGCTGLAAVCSNLEFQSLNYIMGLGRSSEGSVGDLRITNQTIDPLAASPFRLSLNVKEGRAKIIRDGEYNNILRQIVTDQTLIDIEVTNPFLEYVVRYYESGDQGSLVSGFYTPDTADAFKTVTVTNPVAPQYSATATTDILADPFILSSPGHGLPVGILFQAYVDSTGPILPSFSVNGQLSRTGVYVLYTNDIDSLSVMWFDSNTSLWNVDEMVESDDTQTLTIQSPQPFGELNIVESTGTRTRTIQYDSNTADITADHVITLSDNQDGKIRNHESIRINDTIDTTLHTVTKTETDASANVIRKTQTNYKTFLWNAPTSPARQDQSEILTQIEDPDGEAWTTTYTYYDDSLNDGDNYGKRKSLENPDGSWEVYEYDAEGFVSKIIRPYKDSGLSFVNSGNRVTTTTRGTLADLDGDAEVESIKTTIELVDGDEVSRTYSIVWSNVSSGLSLETFFQAAEPGAVWNASGNLRTDRWSYHDGDFNGDIAKEKRVDGTISLYVYSIDPVSGEKTTAILEGAPNLAEDDVIAGTETVTIVNAQGGQVSREVFDIETGFAMSSAVTATNDFDGLGRPLVTVFLDGTTEVRTYQDCCGIDTVTDRTGLTSTTQTELDGTLVSVETNGIVTSYIEGYDTDNSDGVVGFTRTTEVDGRGANDTITSSVETYSPSGRIIASLDPRDSVNRLTLYGQSLNLSNQWERTVTLPNNAVSTQVYHRDGQLFEEHFESEVRQRFEYGVESDTHDGRTFFAITQKVVRLGENDETIEWVKTYRDMLGRIYKVETPDPDGTASINLGLSFYNNLGQRVREVDPDGQQSLYAYNSESELEFTALDVNGNGVIDFGGTDRINRVHELFSDSLRPKTVVRQVFSVYETPGSAAETIVQTTDLSLDGLDTWSTSYGIETHQGRAYNGSGSVTDTTTRADGTTETVTTVNGFITSSITQHSTEGVLANISFTPDDFDRVQLQTDNLLSATWQYSYYETGQLFQSVSPETAVGAGDTQTTTYTYDILGQPLDVTLPDASVQSRRYQADGQLAKTFGSQINPVEFTYDRQGRQRTLKTWQDFNTVTETGTSGSATTTWTYNPLGLLEQKQYDDASNLAYTYSASGRLETKTVARGIVTTYAYDPSTLDQSSISHDDGITASVSYGYDRQGRVETITDASGTRSISYEDGLPLDENYTAGLFNGYQIDRRIDSLNRFDRIRLVAPDSTIPYLNTFGYDGASRLGTVSFNNHTITHTYDPASELRQVQTFNNGMGNTLTVNQRFDKLNRLKSRESLITAGDTRNYTYIYNDLNQRTRATAFDGSYWEYGYDSLGQVDSAIRKDNTDTAIPGFNYGYTFDDIGNRTQTSTNSRIAAYMPDNLNQYVDRAVPRFVDVRGTASTTATVTVNSNTTSRQGDNFHHALDLSAGGNAAQLASVTVTGTLPDGGDGNAPRAADADDNEFLKATPEVFSHDLDGNLTEDGQWTYTWDANNRLVSMETVAAAYAVGVSRQKLEFGYDSQGHRFSKKVYDWDTSAFVLTSDSLFIYDGWNLIAELDASNFTVINSYFWGADLSGSFQGAGGVGGLLAITDIYQSTSYPTYDGNGNVMGYYASDTGVSLADFEYGPFGEKIRENVDGSSQNQSFAFSWSTKYEDMETGLLYYGYRYYNAETGRWLNRDPIEEQGGRNLYGMLGNDTVNHWDFLGLVSNRDIFQDIINTTEICSENYPLLVYEMDRILEDWIEGDSNVRESIDVLSTAAADVRGLFGKYGASGSLSALDFIAKVAVNDEVLKRMSNPNLLLKGSDYAQGTVTKLENSAKFYDKQLGRISSFIEIANNATSSDRAAINALLAISTITENVGRAAGPLGSYYTTAIKGIDDALDVIGRTDVGTSLSELSILCDCSSSNADFFGNKNAFSIQLNTIRNDLGLSKRRL